MWNLPSAAILIVVVENSADERDVSDRHDLFDCDSCELQCPMAMFETRTIVKVAGETQTGKYQDAMPS